MEKLDNILARLSYHIMHPPIVVGQFVWAASQALVIILLASAGEPELAGITILALAIYAPLSLITDLNLRNQLAVDRDGTINTLDALVFRGATGLITLIITLIIIAMSSNSLEGTLIASFIVASRFLDRICDIVIGVYLRTERLHFIGRSVMLRGFANIVPYLFAYVSVISFVTATILALLTSLVFVIVNDLRSVLGTEKALRFKGNFSQFFTRLKDNKTVMPFPFFDSVHANSMKYCAALFLPLIDVGYLGVAQTLYAPFSIVVTAIGFKHLHRSSKASAENDSQDLSRSLRNALLLASGLAVSIILGSALAPIYLVELIGLPKGVAGKELLFLVSVSIAPLMLVGFPCQTLLCQDWSKSYLASPVLGVIVFWLIACFALAMGWDIDLYKICVFFFVSVLARLVFSLLCVRLSLRAK